MIRQPALLYNNIIINTIKMSYVNFIEYENQIKDRFKVQLKQIFTNLKKSNTTLLQEKNIVKTRNVFV